MAKYSDYNNVFLIKNIAKLLENIRINEYTIKLEKNKQSLCGLIDSLRLIELKTLKTYIKTNLANGFIQLSKSFAIVYFF